MTLAHSKFFLDVVVVDASGVNRSNMRYDLDYADWAALNTAVGAGAITQIITDLNAVTDGLVLSYRVGEAFAEDTETHGAAGSEVENVALITALIDGESNKYATLRIPAPNDGIFLASFGAGRNVVDPADSNLQTYLEHFSSDGECLVSDGEKIADPVVSGNTAGKRIHRASRKG